MKINNPTVSPITDEVENELNSKKVTVLLAVYKWFYVVKERMIESTQFFGRKLFSVIAEFRKQVIGSSDCDYRVTTNSELLHNVRDYFEQCFTIEWMLDVEIFNLYLVDTNPGLTLSFREANKNNMYFWKPMFDSLFYLWGNKTVWKDFSELRLHSFQ